MQRAPLTCRVFLSAMILATVSRRAAAWTATTALPRLSAAATASKRRTLLHAPTLSAYQHDKCTALRSFSDDNNSNNDDNDYSYQAPPEPPTGNLDNFKPGDKIQIEIISFGPMGASVAIIGTSHDPDDLIPEEDPALALGLVLQKEIQYFRQARDNIDVVRGEVLPAFIERVRPETNRVDVGLRAFGGKAKADEVATMIMDRLDLTSSGTLNVGDKSAPEDIAAEFPGVSKSSFKRAVSALYKAGKVVPNRDSIQLIKQPGGRDQE